MRTIQEIAHDITNEWRNINYAAKPYLTALRWGEFGFEGKDGAILYFLCNATGFRGQRARELKAELKQHLN